MKKTVDFAINHMHKMPTTNTPYKKKKRNQKKNKIVKKHKKETIKNFKSQENKINITKPLQKQHTLQQP